MLNKVGRDIPTNIPALEGREDIKVNSPLNLKFIVQVNLYT